MIRLGNPTWFGEYIVECLRLRLRISDSLKEPPVFGEKEYVLRMFRVSQASPRRSTKC